MTPWCIRACTASGPLLSSASPCPSWPSSPRPQVIIISQPEGSMLENGACRSDLDVRRQKLDVLKSAIECELPQLTPITLTCWSSACDWDGPAASMLLCVRHLGHMLPCENYRCMALRCLEASTAVLEAFCSLSLQ